MNNYRSKFEERLAKDLEDFTYECTTLMYNKRTNRKMECLDCGSQHVLQKAKYLTDFRLSNGIYIEAKGWFKPSDRTKMESVIKCNPDVDIRMLFQKNGWTTKKKIQKYSQWCDKRKIKWAVGKVPIEWVKE
tara:strand:- start:1260 stop:1655 length:396 start_codon:yes stop_codon:yes gene_type:complete